MRGQNNIIEIERFIDKKNVKKNLSIVISFTILFVVFGLVEKNLFLPDEGLGLLEHINIWIFLLSNSIIPFLIYKKFKILEKNIAKNAIKGLKDTFNKNAKQNLVGILFKSASAIGFCFFVGNSLQNANIINRLPFDYWDSIRYIVSYIVSRLYKLYLFVYFIPITLIYVFILIRSISELLVINEEEMQVYPIKNYVQLNTLCNYGFNILLIMLIPFVLFISGVYWVHGRFDITTTTTIIISIICTLSFLSMYLLLINRFYVSIVEYKKKNIKEIDSKLSEIHRNIIDFQLEGNNYEILEAYLKKEEYLRQSKDRIEKLDKFPLVFRAISASISPFIPTLLSILPSAFEYFF